jgi:glycine dehydrogenase subunit 1
VLGGVSLGRLYPGVDALEHALLVAVTETTTEDDIEVLARELEASIKETV